MRTTRTPGTRLIAARPHRPARRLACGALAVAMLALASCRSNAVLSNTDVPEIPAMDSVMSEDVTILGREIRSGRFEFRGQVFDARERLDWIVRQYAAFGWNVVTADGDSGFASAEFRKTSTDGTLRTARVTVTQGQVRGRADVLISSDA